MATYLDRSFSLLIIMTALPWMLMLASGGYISGVFTSIVITLPVLQLIVRQIYKRTIFDGPSEGL